MTDFDFKKWYVFGDSLSKGIIYNPVTDKHEITTGNYIRLLTDKFNLTVKNNAKFGATIKKGLNMFDRTEKRITDHGVALLEFGGNDCDFLWNEVALDPDFDHQPNVPLVDYRESFLELIRNVQKKGLYPILISLPPLVENKYFDFFSRELNKENILKFLGGSPKQIYQLHESYNAEIPVLARQTDSLFIDLRQAFLIEKNPEKFICEDGIHPNERGYQFIADVLGRELTALGIF